MACYNIMTILVNRRRETAVKLQDVLTTAGCKIKTRIGLHETGEFCAEDGLIFLHLDGTPAEIGALEDALNILDGVKAHTLNLCSDW